MTTLSIAMSLADTACALVFLFSAAMFLKVYFFYTNGPERVLNQRQHRNRAWLREFHYLILFSTGSVVLTLALITLLAHWQFTPFALIAFFISWALMLRAITFPTAR